MDCKEIREMYKLMFAEYPDIVTVKDLQAMLGISRPVIKAHGSSDDRAVFNAIRQAMLFADSGIIDEITNNMDYMRLTQPAAAPEA